MPNKNNQTVPQTTEQKIQSNELSRSTITGIKNGVFIREDVRDRFKRLRDQAKKMTNKKTSFKQIKTAQQVAMEARDAESQRFYNAKLKRQEDQQNALDRLAKKIRQELPKPQKSVMSPTERPKSYKYMSPTEQRLIDLSLNK